MDRVNVLLIGGGGREHALAWRLAQSPRLGTLYVTHHENPGLAALGKVVDAPVSAREAYRAQQFCDHNNIGLVVIGPEEPLAEGLGDKLIAPGRAVFGPSREAAQLEADKAWCKELLRSGSIPTGDARIFTDAHGALAYLDARVRDDKLLHTMFGPARDFDSPQERGEFLISKLPEAAGRIPGADKDRGENMRARAVLSTVIAAAETFRDHANRRAYIANLVRTMPLVSAAFDAELSDLPVIKASGLAKGKGVILPRSMREAESAIDRIMVRREFGDAGAKIVIEEKLSGPEVSVLAMVDGRNILTLPPCQDHKRLLDGDQGPNTGGMGAYSPAALVTPALHERIMREVIHPTLRGLVADGMPYTGFLYAGIMLAPDGTPNVLEFNCRLGDPETQPILMRLRSDLTALCEGALDGRLDRVQMDWDPRAALGVVLAAEGYPHAVRTGERVHGLEAAARLPGKVFHAGTVLRDGVSAASAVAAAPAVLSSGGRVLCAVGLGDSVLEARSAAYALTAKISFAGMHYRSDIGHRALKA